MNKIITSKPIIEYPFYENGKMILYLKIKDLGIKDINYGTIQITDRQGKYSKLVKYHKNDLLDKIKCNN